MTYKDHEIFSDVAKYLEEDNIDTTFYSTSEIISDEELKNLDVVVGKKSRDEVYQTLRKAESLGTKTLNGLKTHLMSDNNQFSYKVLKEHGFNIPKWFNEYDFEGKVVKKLVSERIGQEPRLIEVPDPEPGYFHQEYIPNEGLDYKIYGVDIGNEKKIYAAVTPSKLTNENGRRQRIELNDGLWEETSKIMEIFDNACMLGIDMIENGNKRYVVDVNAAPSFRGIYEAPYSIYQSIKSLLREEENNKQIRVPKVC